MVSSSSILIVSLFAIGGSFTPKIINWTTPFSLVLKGSDALNKIESLPKKFSFGLYIRLFISSVMPDGTLLICTPLLCDNIPFLGSDSTLKVNESASISEPSNINTCVESSFSSNCLFKTIGTSLIGVIVILKVSKIAFPFEVPSTIRLITPN